MRRLRSSRDQRDRSESRGWLRDAVPCVAPPDLRSDAYDVAAQLACPQEHSACAAPACFVEPVWRFELDPASAALRQLSLQYCSPSCAWHVQGACAQRVAAVSTIMACSFVKRGLSLRRKV
jgi:hypothetical protein